MREGRHHGIDNGPNCLQNVANWFSVLPQEVVLYRAITLTDPSRSIPLWLSADAHVTALSDFVSRFHLGTIPTVGNKPSVWDLLPLAALDPPKN